MKKIIASALLLVGILASVPSYAVWVCYSTNERQSNQWYWHAYNHYNAVQGALSSCQNSGNTYNANTCHITSCNWQPYWN